MPVSKHKAQTKSKKDLQEARARRLAAGSSTRRSVRAERRASAVSNLKRATARKRKKGSY